MIVAVWGSCGRGYLTDGNCLLHGRMNSSPSLVSMGDGRPDRLSHEYRLFNTTEYRRVFFYFLFFFFYFVPNLQLLESYCCLFIVLLRWACPLCIYFLLDFHFRFFFFV